MVALSKLRVQNLLSFGKKGVEVELEPLNVLIGPNGSGKSNFIEVLGLLNDAPDDLAEPFRETGGVTEWIWKGDPENPAAVIEATVNVPRPKNGASSRPRSKRKPVAPISAGIPLRYTLSFRPNNYLLEILDERVESNFPSGSARSPNVYLTYESGRPTLIAQGKKRILRPEEANPRKSVLSQWKDPDNYPELTELGRLFSSFRFYRDWEFGIGARAREASPADAPTDFLEESARNLAVMINRLINSREVGPDLVKYLKLFYAEAESINTTVMVGRIEVRLKERKFDISAARLSDGTLRWLALLTILLHPSPPPLVCLEEPELGLHPDVIRPLAKLLIQASQRMQLVVTTHSDTLVEGLTETPEAVIVCEKEEGATTLKRLKRDDLFQWLEKYNLGDLWHKGQIGGTRW